MSPIVISGLATSRSAMDQLRDGCLNALSEYLVDQGIPEGADVWYDRITEAAVDEVLKDIAVTIDAAFDRAQARARPADK